MSCGCARQRTRNVRKLWAEIDQLKGRSVDYVLCAYDIHHRCESGEVPMAVTRCITCRRALCAACDKDHAKDFGPRGRWPLGCSAYCEKEKSDA